MWEQCGDVLYYDQVGHGVSPPSDPTEMATFYQTCKPIFDANPPPDPDAVILDPIVASVICGFGSAQELEQCIEWINHPIPSEVWDELREGGLIGATAPTPS